MNARIVLLVCIMGALSSGAGLAAVPKIETLPIKFYQLAPVEVLKAYPPYSMQLWFPDDRQAQEQMDQLSLYMQHGRVVASIVSDGSLSEPWKEPLKLVTGSLEDDPSVMLSTVNKTIISPIFIRDATTRREGSGAEKGVARNFDLVDLFGCQVDASLYVMIGWLDSMGTLVLPFPGVDFNKIERLPKRINKLVVYNAVIDRRFDELARDLEDLQELVLWGCRDSNEQGVSLPEFRVKDSEFAAPKPIIPVIGSRIRRLTLVNCTGNLVDQLSGQTMPALQSVETTSIFGARGSWRQNVNQQEGKVGWPQPEYANLEKVKYYVYNKPTEHANLDTEIWRSVMLRSLDMREVEVEVIFLNTRTAPPIQAFSTEMAERKAKQKSGRQK